MPYLANMFVEYLPDKSIIVMKERYSQAISYIDLYTGAREQGYYSIEGFQKQKKKYGNVVGGVYRPLNRN